ncbi:MAG: oligosaccharide flippase family protein [Candidatus Hodarchaeota archaeon]
MEQQKSEDFVQNSYILIVGYLISSIISTLGTIVMIRLISVEEYSLVTIAYIFPAILIPFGELGLNYASTNFIAKKLKENDHSGIRNIIKLNLIIKAIIGLIFTLSIAFFSVYIAKYIYNVNDERIYILIQISSIAIFSSLLYEALTACFLGAQKVRYVQIGTILYVTLRASISILLILLGFSLLGPILGIVLSASILMIIYLILYKISFKKEMGETNQIEWKELKEMIKYGHPLILFSIIAGIQCQIFLLILSLNGYSIQVSFYNIAVISAAIISIITKSLSYTLFPIFSKFSWDKEKERQILINYYQFSIKYGTFLVIPVTIFVILFSNIIVPILFGAVYKDASIFVSIYFFIFLTTSFGLLSIPAFFNGQNQTQIALYFEIIFFSTGVISALVLVMYIGSIGVVVGFVIGHIFAVLYGNIMIWKKFGTKFFGNLKNVIAIFIIAVLTGILVYLAYTVFLMYFPIRGYVFHISLLVISFTIYFVLFLILTAFFSLVSESEINLLISSFEKFPILNKVFKILARIEKKIIKLRK